MVTTEATPSVSSNQYTIRARAFSVATGIPLGWSGPQNGAAYIAWINRQWDEFRASKGYTGLIAEAENDELEAWLKAKFLPDEEIPETEEDEREPIDDDYDPDPNEYSPDQERFEREDRADRMGWSHS